GVAVVALFVGARIAVATAVHHAAGQAHHAGADQVFAGIALLDALEQVGVAAHVERAHRRARGRVGVEGPVVALLDAGPDHAVAALCGHAGAQARVAVVEILIVTIFARIDDAVATHTGGAVGVAAIAVERVAVVTLLAGAREAVT